MTDEPDETLKLELVEWEGAQPCLYLNDFRIAGGKPWGGGKTIRTWKVRRSCLLEAMGKASDAQVKP